jgi:sugar phosphate isomerase/epimerase
MKLSVQCYTLRDDFAKDVWGTFKALRNLGLNYVEIGGTYGMPARDLKAGLDDLGLRVSANHVGIQDLESKLDEVIDENLTLGNMCIVLPWIGEDRYGKGWGLFAKELEPIGAKIRAAGMTFAYHNHNFEFKLENGKPGLDVFYETADPKLIAAQIDTYWVAYGGGDPAAYIRKLKGRLPQIHCKDGKLGGEPLWLEVGQGELDWDGILAAARESNVEVASIELDVCPRPPIESVKMSVEFLRSRGVSE